MPFYFVIIFNFCFSFFSVSFIHGKSKLLVENRTKRRARETVKTVVDFRAALYRRLYFHPVVYKKVLSM